MSAEQHPASDREDGELRAELARLYRGLEPEAPADAIEDADAATRSSVAWLRSAWESLEVPRAAPPAARGLPRPSLRRRVALALVAAALLVGLGQVIWRTRTSQDPGVEPAVVQRESSPDSSTSETEIQLASLSSDHIEMRSGPVRLVLYTGPRGN